MANIASAKKRARQNLRRNAHNAAQRSMMRTYIKRVRQAIAAGEWQRAQETYQQAVPVIDRMCSKRLLHKNKAARFKSRLNHQIRGLQQSS